MLLTPHQRALRAAAAAVLTLALCSPVAAQYVLQEIQSPNQKAEGYFGWDTAGVPDVNGDGRGDLLIGSFGESPLGAPEQAGRAYLLDGATGAVLRTLTSPNEQTQGIFGSAVASVPDADGDGRGDLLIGARSETTGASPPAAGRAYLFSGATGALLRTLVSPNEEDFGRFGAAVAGVPDADGDGRGDLLVGASEDPGASPDEAGRAYLFSGATGALLFEFASPNAELQGLFGAALAGVPDADGDGRGDLLIGARQEDPDPSPIFSGRAYLFSGATGALLFELASPNEETLGDFGSSVSGVPDADGDGRGDLLIGAERENPGSTPGDAGRAYLFSGATGAMLFEFASPNPETQGFFGFSVSGVPDTDGDGRGDLLIGAVFEDPSGSPPNSGRAYLFSGATGALLSVYVSPNEAADGRFGFTVSGVPDTNGDGRGDVLAGAYFEDPGSAPENSGRAYLFAGGVLPAVIGIAATPQAPPVNIPANGGDFTFTVTLNNATSRRQAVDAWAVARLPNGATFGPVIGPVRVRLSSGVTAGPVTLQQSVPAQAPVGEYFFVVQTGQFPLAAAADSFAVEKTLETPVRPAPGDYVAAWRTVEVTDGSPVLAAETVPVAKAEQTRTEAQAALGAYPNPFRHQTALRFATREAGPVRLAVYDVTGREVAVLVDGVVEAGTHEAAFVAEGLASGVYVYRLTAGQQTQTGRLTLVK